MDSTQSWSVVDQDVYQSTQNSKITTLDILRQKTRDRGDVSHFFVNPEKPLVEFEPDPDRVTKDTILFAKSTLLWSGKFGLQQR